MKFTTSVRSLKDLRAAYISKHPDAKIAEPKVRQEKPRKCRICGGEMFRKTGTNVWVCGGTLTVPDKDSKVEGATKEVPCENIALSAN